jgi:hypothetical protein
MIVSTEVTKEPSNLFRRFCIGAASPCAGAKTTGLGCAAESRSTARNENHLDISAPPHQDEVSVESIRFISQKSVVSCDAGHIVRQVESGTLSQKGSIAKGGIVEVEPNHNSESTWPC